MIHYHEKLPKYKIPKKKIKASRKKVKAPNKNQLMIPTGDSTSA